MGCHLQPIILHFVGALCLLCEVTTLATDVEPMDGAKMAQYGLNSKLVDISNQSFSLEDLNTTEEFLNFESLLPNDTVMSAAEDELEFKNESSLPYNAEKETMNSSANATSIKIDNEESARNLPQVRTPPVPVPSAVKDSTTTQNPMSRINRLRLQRQLRRMQRLQFFQREIPRRLGLKTSPKVSEEMKQRVLEIMSQDNGFHVPIRTSFETHRCYRAACALPNGTDSRLWNDLSQPAVRLFSPLPKINRRSARNIEGARLKLFVNPRHDCLCSETSDDRPTLLVTVYQFIRPLSYRKKHRVVYRRKFLSDIRVPREGNVFIALDITSAVKTWMIKSRRNFGLEVTVQDVNETFLDARNVFGLPNCNSPSERSCRDDDGKSIEFIRFSGSRFGTNFFPFETVPYVDVVTSRQSDDEFDKYTLHPRRSRRQIRSENSAKQNRSLPRRDNIGLLLSQQLTAKRQKARRLRQFGNQLRNQGEKGSNPFSRHQLALSDGLQIPPAGSSPSFSTKPYSCDCSRRKSTVKKEILTTTTENSATLKKPSTSLADTKSQSALDNVTNEKKNRSTSSVNQNAIILTESAASTNSTVTGQEENRFSQSNQTAKTTSTLEWKVILQKLHQREPLCRPKTIQLPIKDKRVITPKVYSTLECPTSCKICKGKKCVRQTCWPEAYDPIYGTMAISSGQIVKTALPGYSTVTKCRC